MHTITKLGSLLLLATVLVRCGVSDASGTAPTLNPAVPLPSPTAATTIVAYPTPHVSTPAADQIAGWRTYASAEGEYMLSVPINWPLQDDGHGWVVFQDPNGQAGGEDGSVRGGVELPGRHTDALSATFGLPNHAQPARCLRCCVILPRPKTCSGMSSMPSSQWAITFWRCG